jgi:hypothetical protein
MARADPSGRFEVSLENSSPQPLLRLVAGPGRTVALGYEDGTVGIWDLDSGVMLAGTRLHGAITHLVEHDGALYAASDLGDHVTWDLSVYVRGYCDLLREVWSEVPVVWRDGQAARATTERHWCSQTQGRQ